MNNYEKLAELFELIFGEVGTIDEKSIPYAVRFFIRTYERSKFFKVFINNVSPESVPANSIESFNEAKKGIEEELIQLTEIDNFIRENFADQYAKHTLDQTVLNREEFIAYENELYESAGVKSEEAYITEGFVPMSKLGFTLHLFINHRMDDVPLEFVAMFAPGNYGFFEKVTKELDKLFVSEGPEFSDEEPSEQCAEGCSEECTCGHCSDEPKTEK